MLRIEIHTDNAAFEDAGEAEEVARILERLARDYRSMGRLDAMKLRDINGNTVGNADVVEC